MSLLTAVSAALLVSCDLLSFLDDEDGDDDDDYPTTEVTVNGVMKSALLSGVVRDTDGNPMSDVTVASGTSVAKTNSAGLFSFTELDIVAERPVVRFSKTGYFDVVRSLKVDGEATWDIVMCKKENGNFSSTTAYTSSVAKELKAGGMKIDMPQDGYMVDSNGKAYSGKLKAEMIYLDPNNEHFADMMPGGDLAAVCTDGSDAMLLSYGMTAVNLTDKKGNKLQLKEGAEATLTFPIPDGMTENLPSSIPLWSFNETTGLWEEEGVAILKGNSYVGTVKHFSWVNLDYPEKQAVVEGYVTDESGQPVVNTKITIGQTYAYTNANGYYRHEVVANEDFDIWVKSKDYGNYSNVFTYHVSALTPREVREVDIVLPTLYNVYGRIVNEAGGSNTCSIWITYGNKKTTSVVSRYDGTFVLYAPEGYAGSATLNVQTLDGDIITKDILVGKYNVDVGDILISSETGNDGRMSVVLSDGCTIDMKIYTPDDYYFGEGVIVFDRHLVIEQENDEETNYFGLDLTGYDANKSSFDNAVVEVMDNNHVLFCDGASSNVMITRKTGKFIFNLSGRGEYSNYSGAYDPEAVFTATGVAVSVCAVMVPYRNVQPRSVGGPTFMPVLTTAAPLVGKVTEGYMGTGAIAFYNGTREDFQTLKAQAEKAGLKKVDDEDDEIMYYYKGKFIDMYYESEGSTVDGEFDPLDSDPQIFVAALENVSESVLYSAPARKVMSRKLRSKKKILKH